MRALVTGGAGFIGSNLVDALAGRGDEVVVVDDLSTGRRENLKDSKARLVELDVADAKRLGDLVALTGPQVIFHLAAQVDVRRSVAEPARDLAVNGGGTLAVLEAARQAGVRKVVYASTGGAIYGDTDVLPTPEETPPRPLSPYGQSKYAGEGYCRLYSQLYGLSASSLRFANVYGPRQDPLGEGGVIAIFCGRALSGERAVIFGDGEQTRDFVYVADVVEALLLAGDHDGFGPFNVGTGTETTVNELARRVEAAAARPFEPEHDAERPGEVRRSCLDPARAASGLGFTARTGLDAGLEKTLDWARRQPS